MTKKEFEDMYRTLTPKEMAHRLGCSVATIHNFVRRLGIKTKRTHLKIVDISEE